MNLKELSAIMGKFAHGVFATVDENGYPDMRGWAVVERLAEPEARAAEACRSFEAARAFDSQALDRARKDFYQAFVHEEDQNPCAD